MDQTGGGGGGGRLPAGCPCWLSETSEGCSGKNPTNKIPALLTLPLLLIAPHQGFLTQKHASYWQEAWDSFASQGKGGRELDNERKGYVATLALLCKSKAVIVIGMEDSNLWLSPISFVLGH